MADKKTLSPRVVSNTKFMKEMDELLKRVDKTVDLGEAFFAEIDEARKKSEGIIGRLTSPKMKEIERGIKEVLDECMNKPSADVPYMGKAKSSHETSRFDNTHEKKRRKIKI